MFNTEVYSPREIARAAGVPDEQVVARVGGSDVLLGFAEAVEVGRAAAAESGGEVGATEPAPLFSLFSAVGAPRHASKGVPLAISSTLHVAMIALAIFVTTLGIRPTAATLSRVVMNTDKPRLVFLATPGPGGGGGGGGTFQKSPAPHAQRAGRRAISSPLPVRRPPRPITPVANPPEPTPPPLDAEPLPAIVAPIVAAPADARDRIGVVEPAASEIESRGSGQGGGAGTGAGTGIGSGDGSGVGDGSGGGTGGGPYRPGSGIEPPRLLREVKAEYSEDARRRGVEGDVVLEIVVKRDGSVGEVRLLDRLGAGLDERAIQAVRQWRFSPALRRGTAVDVLVEVAVEFKLR